MKGLLIKDLYTLLNFKKQYALLLVCVGGWSVFVKSFSFLAMYSILLGGMLVFSVISMDEAVHFDRYALTMPISVRTLVKEKYALNCICIASGTLIALLIEGISMLLTWSEGTEEWIMLILVSTLFLIAYNISLPVIFKYGVEKARYVYMVAMVGIAGVVIAVVYLTDDTPVMLFEGVPSAQSSVLLMGILLVLDAAVVAISYQVSMKVVEGKEW